MSFNFSLIWSSDGPRVQWSRTIYTILKEGIMGEHSCELGYMKFGPVAREEMLSKDQVYGRWTAEDRRRAHDGHRTKSEHNTSPLFYGSDELKGP